MSKAYRYSVFIYSLREVYGGGGLTLAKYLDPSSENLLYSEYFCSDN